VLINAHLLLSVNTYEHIRIVIIYITYFIHMSLDMNRCTMNQNIIFSVAIGASRHTVHDYTYLHEISI